MPVPIQQSGYESDFMGFGVREELVPINTYSQMLKESFINKTPTPYDNHERIPEGSQNRKEDEVEDLGDDTVNDDTVFQRASNFMTDRARSLLDVNNDGILDSGDIKQMASGIKDSAVGVVSSASASVENKISDIGAESIKKSGAVEVVDVKTDRALVVLTEKTDLALLQVENLGNSVEARITDVSKNLAMGAGFLAIAYIVFSK